MPKSHVFDHRRPCQVIHPSEAFPVGAVIFPVKGGGHIGLLYCPENIRLAKSWPGGVK